MFGEDGLKAAPNPKTMRPPGGCGLFVMKKSMGNVSCACRDGQDMLTFINIFIVTRHLTRHQQQRRSKSC